MIVKKTKRLLFITLLCFVGTLVALKNAGNLLCVCDDPVQSTAAKKYDGIVLLMGDARGNRAQTVSKLLARDVAPVVYILKCEDSLYSRAGIVPNEAVVANLYLERELFVPANKIKFLGDTHTTSTTDEAKTLLNYFQSDMATSMPKSLLIVTSWFHTSRARYTFRKVFEPAAVNIDAVAVFPERASIWWHEEEDFLGAFNEYLKWTYYLFFKRPNA